MQFDFDKEEISNGYLDINDLGNCAIRGTNDMMEDYYLVIKTTMGKSSIFQYGPIVPDIILLPDGVSCSFSRIDYNEKAIIKTINLFLNAKYHNIKYAVTLDKDEALDCCRDLIEYMRCEEDYD